MSKEFNGNPDKDILLAIYNVDHEGWKAEPEECERILDAIRLAGFQVLPVPAFGPEPDESGLYCALCFYSPLNDDNSANKAETVVRGYAVCYDHMGYLAQGMEFGLLLSALKREQPKRS